MVCSSLHKSSGTTDDRNQNFSFRHASIRCAMSMFWSSFEIGMYRFNSNAAITREMRTMKLTNAAFSKSVICTSIDRNSTRQPMCSSLVASFWLAFGGGGFHLTDWRVEFRSMEVQITDFENAAFVSFIVLG